MATDRSTIAALSTAPAPSGVAVIRVSGPAAAPIVSSLFSSRIPFTEQPRVAVFGRFHAPRSREKLDSGLVLFMPGPHSFTGEDVCELHVHGSPVIVREILRILYAQGAAPAEPGEFTRRAFINDKLDLIQAEAIGDIIEASNLEAVKIAQDQLAGRLSSVLTEIGEPLRDIVAELEAGIDFPEEDIDPDSLIAMSETLAAIGNRVDTLIASYEYGHIVRDGFRVVLYGRPNVGKSSLLNHLLGSDRAIVTDISGTTRDTLEEQAMIGGVQFVFCDTAGITITSDRVERIGIERARQRLTWADLVLFIIDASQPGNEWRSEFEQVQAIATTIPVVNKTDIAPAFRIAESEALYISVATGAGCASLTDTLLTQVQSRAVDVGSSNQIVTNERHRDCLRKARAALAAAEQGIADSLPAEIVSAELRLALSALEELIGRTDTEDILGRIFSKFCIGK